MELEEKGGGWGSRNGINRGRWNCSEDVLQQISTWNNKAAMHGKSFIVIFRSGSIKW